MRKPFPAGMEMVMWEGYTVQHGLPLALVNARCTAVAPLQGAKQWHHCKVLVKGYVEVYKLWQAWNKCQVQVGDWVVIVT